MIFGAHSFIFTERWSDASLDILDRAKSLGLDSFELGVGDDVIFDHCLTRQRAESLGLELTTSPGGLWPYECDLSSDDPAERASGLDYHKRQVDTTAELGAVAYCGALYGHPGVVKRESPRPDTYHHIAEGLSALADYAGQQGVDIVLEPMSHFRTHVANTPAQIVALIKMAGQDNVFALMDTYHLITEVRDYRQAIHTFGDKLWGLHACENDRGAPGGGLVPWQSVFDGLRDIRFDGRVIFEAYNSSIGDFAYERGMFHNVCPNADDFVAKSLAFFKTEMFRSPSAEHDSQPVNNI